MPANARILLIRLGRLGDVVFTLPAVQALRAAYPEAKLTFLTDRALAPLLEGFGQFEQVLWVDRAAYKALKPGALVGGTLALLSQIARARFDLTVDFQGFGETGWLSWWSGASERWGNVDRPSRAWAYTHAVQRNRALHPVQCHLDLLRQAGGVAAAPLAGKFSVPESAMAEARQIFRDHGLEPTRPTLLVHPFTSSQEKNWPMPLFLAIAQRARQAGVQVIFGGGPADVPGLAVAREAGFAVAAGTPLLVSAGLADLSTVVLGGDSGLPHLAIALGKRVIMIMRTAQAGACYPFGHPEWAVVPAVRPDLTTVPLQDVWQACDTAMAELGIMGAGEHYN